MFYYRGRRWSGGCCIANLILLPVQLLTALLSGIFGGRRRRPRRWY